MSLSRSRTLQKLAIFIKCIGWIRSPDGICIICSSSATFRQAKPSDANSIVLREAFWCSSLAEHHIVLGYSWRVGMGITATLWWRDTRRLDFVLLEDVALSGKVASDACFHVKGDGRQNTMTLDAQSAWSKFLPSSLTTPMLTNSRGDAQIIKMYSYQTTNINERYSSIE